ncbi:hypothetical protein [Wukongibacter sp. M2B1]|uniref:hypothetical protein n=1 Tax=Wukongibacter sp. M2B1 TaxID=3088895 RepID=UPI003D78E088
MASNTPNIDLYKKNPITDGDDTFNIETMLNENWDKVDTEVGDLKTSRDNLSTQMTELVKVKQNITILSTGWVDDTTTSGYWYYDISDADIYVNTVVDVNIALVDIDKVKINLISVTDSSDGYARIYAIQQPTENFTADIVITKVVF